MNLENLQRGLLILPQHYRHPSAVELVVTNGKIRAPRTDTALSPDDLLEMGESGWYQIGSIVSGLYYPTDHWYIKG